MDSNFHGATLFLSGGTPDPNRLQTAFRKVASVVLDEDETVMIRRTNSHHGGGRQRATSSTGRYSVDSLSAALAWLQTAPSFSSLGVEIKSRRTMMAAVCTRGRDGDPDVVTLDLSARHTDATTLNVNELVTLFRYLASNVGLSVGYVISSAMPARFRRTVTELEQQAHEKGARFGESARQKYVPSIGWAVWLTQGHIRALGGSERISAVAPVRKVYRERTGVWLELSESPWRITEEDLYSLETYLAPVIPSIGDLVDAQHNPAHGSLEPGAFVMRIDSVLAFQGTQVIGEWLEGALPGPGELVYVALNGSDLVACTVKGSRPQPKQRQVVILLEAIPGGSIATGTFLSTDRSRAGALSSSGN